MTPMQRSLKLLRDRGYLVAIVERWNHYAKIRQDLWSFVDILAIKSGEVLAVQTTSVNNVASRIHKIVKSDHICTVLSAGIKVTVHGWGKTGPRGQRKMWECREESVDAATAQDPGRATRNSRGT